MLRKVKCGVGHILHPLERWVEIVRASCVLAALLAAASHTIGIERASDCALASATARRGSSAFHGIG